jgi:hypothetical protein
MANSLSTADLLRGALQKAGELTDGNSDFHDIALRYMNNAYLDLLSGSSIFDPDAGDPYPWALSRSPKTLTLKAFFETGSIAVNQDSTTATLSPAPAAGEGSFKDRHLKIDGVDDYYRVSAHTAGSATLTLEHAFVDANVSGSNYRLHKLIYDIGSDVLRLAAPMRVYRNKTLHDDDDGKIYGINHQALEDNYPLYRLQTGIPTRFSEVYRDDTEYLVQFDKSSSEDAKVDFKYVPVPSHLVDSSTDYPVLPREKRFILEFATAHFLLVDKEDEKASYYFNATSQALKGIIEAKNKEVQHTSKQRGQLVPRADLVSNRKFKSGGY